MTFLFEILLQIPSFYINYITTWRIVFFVDVCVIRHFGQYSVSFSTDNF